MVVDHDGFLPPTSEGAVAALVALAKQQLQEIIGLRQMNKSLAERVDAQSELLTRKAERIDDLSKEAEVVSEPTTRADLDKPMNTSTGRRKG